MKQLIFIGLVLALSCGSTNTEPHNNINSLPSEGIEVTRYYPSYNVNHSFRTFIMEVDGVSYLIIDDNQGCAVVKHEAK